jgi:hypothetical protein
VALLLVLTGGTPLAGQPIGRPERIDTVAPGITWYRAADPRGPWQLSVVRVDLTVRSVALRAVRAQGVLTGREPTSTIAARDRARVAINADFFDLRTGAVENNQVTDAEWWQGRMVTDSPFDTYDNVHAQFALSRSGVPSIDRYVLDGRAWVRELLFPLLGVNVWPRTTPLAAREGSALFTPRAGAITPRDTTRDGAEVVLQSIPPRGDTLRYIATTDAITGSGSAIPSSGAVLAAFGDRAASLRTVRVGDTVRVWLGIQPALADGRPPAQLVGGWPRILERGLNVAAEAASREGTISRNAEARHPRSAVGISRDRKTLWLMTVDGRAERSVGMTLVELAEALRQLGAWDALNFDGGGSTTLVIDGRVVNTPSDPTGERPVGNALLVLERR